MKKIIALSCGRKNQFCETLIKAAAMGAEELGVETEIIRAMCRSDYALSYDIVGGRPVFYEYDANRGSQMLTDDGREENADVMQDIIRGRGNDVLRLDATTAQRVGLSRGTTHLLHVTFDPAMSTWPLLRSWVTFVFNAVEYLGNVGEGLTANELSVGEAIATRLPLLMTTTPFLRWCNTEIVWPRRIPRPISLRFRAWSPSMRETRP